jgi:hypothetical protein
MATEGASLATALLAPAKLLAPLAALPAPIAVALAALAWPAR